jgi:hypothetical protein
VKVTFLRDRSGAALHTKELTLPALRDLILSTTAGAKEALPWLKLARFGDKRSDKGSLRHDANVLKITGVELDYDGKLMPFEEAVAITEKAGLNALLYTSPSYTSAAPKWRILLPTTGELEAKERTKLAERVNGLFDGGFSTESFTLSQGYFFGSVNGNPEHRAVIVEGKAIDERADLDAGALGKKKKAKTKGAQPGEGESDDWSVLLGNIAEGVELYTSLRDLAARFVVSGMNAGTCVNLLRGALQTSRMERDARWQARFDAIPQLVESAEEKFAASGGLGEWDAGDDVATPPPRGWLLGNIFARKFMSSLLADGGVGKTALRYAQLLSLATERSLTGDYVFQRCKVLIISLEDDADELRRRILAASLHYGIDRSELRGWLFLSAPGADAGKLMTLDKRGRAVRGFLADNLEAAVCAHKIDIVSIDPFVKSHSVEENSNSAIDDVVQVLTDLADRHNIAVDAPHHTSKGMADPGNASRGRGASAMKDGARLVYTLAVMSPEEAKAFGVSEEQRRLLIRMDSGKVNIAPPLRAAKWFRLVGVPLGNATDMYPNGDEVQTVEVWTPPDTWVGLDADLLCRILADIAAGLPDGNRYTEAPNAGARAAWRVVVKYAPEKTEAQAREIIKTWIKNEVLIQRDYKNPTTFRPAKGLLVDHEKMPS